MNKRLLIGISPWIIIGAVLVLGTVFLLMARESFDRQRVYATNLLMERGESVIRSFEAGVRTGIGLRWEHFQLQKLLMEMAQQQDVDHIVVVDEKGLIMADSDPSLIGETYGTDLDLKAVSRAPQSQWRRVPNVQGADTFEIYRQFKPYGEDEGGYAGLMRPDDVRQGSALPANGRAGRLIIFVGLDMGPIEAAGKADKRHTIMMMAVFLLIGVSGIISLLLAQGYLSTRMSLSRVRAFSDNLVANMPMGLIAVNEKGRVTFFNQAAASMLQRNEGEIIGKAAEDVLPSAFREILDMLVAGDKSFEDEIDFPSVDGRKIPLEVIGTVLADEAGLHEKILLFRDITEIRQLKEEIARNERLAALGGIAAGIAHEIRNPLSSIKGFATYFRQRYGDNHEDAKNAGIMIGEVDRLNRVISQLLDYARPMKMQLRKVALQDVLRHSLRMIEKQAKEKGVIIETDLPADVPATHIDPDRMHQVLLNLYLNALSAMENGGSLAVVLKNMSDGFVCVEIRDTGAGIAPQDINRIFDPYFTTKPSGAGLGLAVVQKIIDAHDARIQVASTPGKGTTVTIILPSLAGAPDQAGDKAL